MSVRTWMSVGILCLVGLYGCGNHSQDLPPTPQGEESTGDEEGMIGVIGSARIRSQCPLGTFSTPQEIPLELWSCPLGLSSVELVQPIDELVIQADCKKKTLDVRGGLHSLKATTWEMMPDGTFFFTLDAGSAVLKDDGMGNANCNTPLLANYWGKVDCTDRDKAIIHMETVWWLGQSSPTQLPSGTPSSHPAPNPSASPTSEPSPWPSAWPSDSPSAVPSASPSASPSGAPLATPFRPFLRVRVTPPTDPHSRGGTACRLPQGCYFHNITKINQCS